MRCPDCNSDDFRKSRQGAFYTCLRCGLSLKPWEIEKARERSKKEIKDLEDKDPDAEKEKKRRDRRKYRNWYEGRENID